MIIFGLGNPGLKYRRTRHNAGCIFIQELAKSAKKRFIRKKGHSIAVLRVRNKKLLLIKPYCWMNQCGLAIRDILKQNQQDFLVVLDDINLPLGRMRLRSKGSDGGHLGLRSIIEVLQTCDFPRLRIGIGPPSMDSKDYVLLRFKSDEMRILKTVVKHGIKGIRMLISDGFVKAQNHINSFIIKDIELDSDR